METLHRAFLAGGNRVGHVPMGKQMLGTELPTAASCVFSAPHWRFLDREQFAEDLCLFQAAKRSFFFSGLLTIGVCRVFRHCKSLHEDNPGRLH